MTTTKSVRTADQRTDAVAASPWLSVSSHLTVDPPASPAAVQIAAAFGLTCDGARTLRLFDNLQLGLDPGRIVLVTGPSGSGKSTLLRIVRRRVRPCVDLNRLRLRRDRILPEHFRLSVPRALHYLSLAGLADAFILLQTPDRLSEGQRYRFRLALALARRPRLIVADAFLENLDPVTAFVVAHNTRRFADRFGKTFLLAATRDDFIDALKPDRHIRLGAADPNPAHPRPQPPPARNRPR